MSLITDMAEETKMLDFLRAKGIKTLAQLKTSFSHSQNEIVDDKNDNEVDEEVEFVKVIAAPSVIQERMNKAMEASIQNKNFLTDVITAGILDTQEQKSVLEKSTVPVDPAVSRCVLNAMQQAVSCAEKKDSSLPMRYRHKRTPQNKPYPKQTKSQQQRERTRQANAIQQNESGMALGVNIQCTEYNKCQYNSNNLNQSRQNIQQHNYYANAIKNHTNEVVGQTAACCYNNTKGGNNATGGNNAKGGSNAKGSNNAKGDNNAKRGKNTHGFNNAHGFNKATVFNNAAGFNKTAVFNKNAVFNNTAAFNNTTVCNNARGYNNATVFNDAAVCNNTAAFNNTAGFNNAEGYNNATVFNNATGHNNANSFINPIGYTNPVTQPLVSTPIFNTVPQQQWATATSIAYTGHNCSNYGQFELACQVPQVQLQPQQSCAQYMMGNRPIFQPN